MKKIKLIITIELDKETGKYVALCKQGWEKTPWPGIASCGDDIPNAIEMVVDALALYLRTVKELSGLWPWEIDPKDTIWDMAYKG